MEVYAYMGICQAIDLEPFRSGFKKDWQNSKGRTRTIGDYSIFTSGVYRATTPDVAFPQEKPHFAALDCAE